MALIEIVHSTYAIAFYNPEKKSIEVTWHGHQTFEEYKSLFTTLLSFQRMSGFEVIGYVSDIRDQGVVSPNSRKWFEQVAIPQAVKQGLKYGAVIFEGSTFKRYYLNLILQVTTVYGLPLKFFNSKEDAYKWVDSLKFT
ncbi:MAG TPA: hypothetical protein DDY04_03200 [Bacteroidales bacterium]|nr:hypothetical protein [Bacteroidales bacterium]